MAESSRGFIGGVLFPSFVFCFFLFDFQYLYSYYFQLDLVASAFPRAPPVPALHWVGGRGGSLCLAAPVLHLLCVLQISHKGRGEVCYFVSWRLGCSSLCLSVTEREC
ncbi:unnamed protein product [Boreogadus saida]